MSEHASLLIVQVFLALVLCAVMAALLILPPELDDRAIEPLADRVFGAASDVSRDAGSAAGAASSNGTVVSAAAIKESLQSRSDLIPFRGVLGGTMGFYSTDDIRVLSDEYVFARFSDGHIQGSMVLEYDARSSEDIRWRVLSATLDR